ncbi:hypothetical protein ACFVZ8_33955 [Streptomyces sp. NPDC059558]|uniref:hypothetical protein n=1 Tax=Streptomyces TaxID=1883 RepID=UPI001331B8DC|nr:hypothetical protein [Streptomyces sp. Sge12]
MSTSLQHSIDLLAHGLLTELPAQLATAALVAAAAAAFRARQRRRGARGSDERDETTSE